MLTLPDFTEKKIVFISSKEDFPNDLKFSNYNIALYKDGQKVNQISCHLVFSVFIIGEFTLTSVLIKKAQEYGISLFFLNNSFEVYTQILSKAEGNYLLREKQYNCSEAFSLRIAKMIVKNKIDNQLQTLKSFNKLESVDKYDNSIFQIEEAKSIDSLRGVEGDFARYYFQLMFKEIGWYRRAPRTKEDIANLLLDIGYTFIFNYVDALLNLFGFDTYKGFYHQLFFQRKSLSCDLIEPIRSMMDKALLKAYHLKQIDEKDFVFQNGSYSFRKKTGIAGKYVNIWFQVIMDNRDEIYLYVLNFYRYIMNSDKYKEPYFDVNHRI